MRITSATGSDTLLLRAVAVAGTAPLSVDPSGPESTPGATAASDADHLDGVVAKMNDAMKLFNRAVEFEVVRGHRVVIRVLDTETHEVIRQMPSEALIKALENMEEQSGLLVNEQL